MIKPSPKFVVASHLSRRKTAIDWDERELDDTSIPMLVQGALAGMRDEMRTLEHRIETLERAWDRTDLDGLSAMGIIPARKLKLLYEARDAQEEGDEETLEKLLLEI